VTDLRLPHSHSPTDGPMRARPPRRASITARPMGTERRTATITVLFCDLVASTERQQRLGDDAADGFRRLFLSALYAAADATHGDVVKSMGDVSWSSFATARSTPWHARRACTTQPCKGDRNPKTYVRVFSPQVPAFSAPDRSEVALCERRRAGLVDAPNELPSRP